MTVSRPTSNDQPPKLTVSWWTLFLSVGAILVGFGFSVKNGLGGVAIVVGDIIAVIPFMLDTRTSVRISGIVLFLGVLVATFFMLGIGP